MSVCDHHDQADLTTMYDTNEWAICLSCGLRIDNGPR